MYFGNLNYVPQPYREIPTHFFTIATEYPYGRGQMIVEYSDPEGAKEEALQTLRATVDIYNERHGFQPRG